MSFKGTKRRGDLNGKQSFQQFVLVFDACQDVNMGDADAAL